MDLQFLSESSDNWCCTTGETWRVGIADWGNSRG